MNDKQALLEQLRSALAAGTITEDEVRSVLPHASTYSMTPSQPSVPVRPESKVDKLSAIDVMFYIAGLVLYGALLLMIIQSWNESNHLLHIMLSAGVGFILWAYAYYIGSKKELTDLTNGLANAMVLTGSLLITTGLFIITNDIIGGFGEVNFLPGALTLAILGAIHLYYDHLLHRRATILMGVFLTIAAFPALLFGFLHDSNLPVDFWVAVIVLGAGMLAYASRIIAKVYPNRENLRNYFDSLATLIALMAMYVASFGDYGVLWLALMLASVFGLFYLSIVAQNKNLLGSASVFLVISVATISFKYFSGAGASLSLIVAAIGLLGTAAVAANINKKYFKN